MQPCNFARLLVRTPMGTAQVKDHAKPYRPRMGTWTHKNFEVLMRRNDTGRPNRSCAVVCLVRYVARERSH